MSSESAYFQGRNRMLQVINGTGRRSQMEDVVHPAGDKDVFGYVVPDEFKIRTPSQVLDIIGITSDQIVDGNDSEPFREQSITQMGTEKSCTSGDHCRFFIRLRFKHEHGPPSEKYELCMSRNKCYSSILRWYVWRMSSA